MTVLIRKSNATTGEEKDELDNVTIPLGKENRNTEGKKLIDMCW